VSRVGALVRLEVAIESKTYRSPSGGLFEALGAVAFGVAEGEVAAIVGPSGCGKTTLMRLIAGLDRDYRGRIARRPGDRLGVVFQEPRLLPWRSAEDNVRIAAPRATEASLKTLFQRFGLAEHRRHLPGELSLGLARRVSLARAIAVEPDLLLLDEPFASLDGATRSSLVEAIAEIVAERAMATLLITHDIDAAIQLADTIHVLSPRPATIVRSVSVPAPRNRMSVETAADLAQEIGVLP